MKATFSDKEIKNKFTLVMLLQAVVEDDRSAFYYIAVSGAMLEEFKQAVEKREVFDLADFGSIILSGYGEPTSDVIKYMEENYKINHATCPKLRMTPEGLKEEPYDNSANS